MADPLWRVAMLSRYGAQSCDGRPCDAKLPPMLTMIGVFVAVMFAVLGVISWRYAPAVTAACCAGLAIGGLALYVVLHHPQPDAPTTVALAASAGIGLGGLIGLLATPRGDA